LKVYRELKEGRYKKDELEELLLQRGFMNRLLGRRFRRFVSESWHMYPVGVLFGLGFDTASEVGLLAITATAATSIAQKGSVRIPFMGILALPILFTAGMSLMDTTDGVFMSKAYGWAFTSPLRKVYYNMTTTALSVFVALGVGTLEYLGVASHQLHVDNGFVTWLNRLNFETLGYLIVASFVLAWVASIAVFKWRRIEDRWGGMISE
jgi:high-affinity nickel-transport protein